MRSMDELDVEVRRGQAVYSRAALKAYDLWVLGISCSLIWKCPQLRMIELYRRHLAGNHLDIGVGTGRLIDRADPPTGTTITLADLNTSSLAAAAGARKRYRPATIVANALEPLPLTGGFGSAGLNFLLHCLPGPMSAKADAVTHAANQVVAGGTVFGSTILASGVPVTGAARRLMALYNAKGIFHNESDSLDDLHAELGRRLDDVRVETVGCVALFSGKSSGTPGAGRTTGSS